MNAGVDKLGFNKLGGGILILGWVVILVVVLVLVSEPGVHGWAAAPRSTPPWLTYEPAPLADLRASAG